MSNVSFPTAGIDRISNMEEAHFWFVGRQAMLTNLLDKYEIDKSQIIVDVGCGTGYGSQLLSRSGYSIIALDYYFEGIGQLNPTPVPYIQADALHLPFGSKKIDTVLLLDVIEHTDDEVLLRHIHRILQFNGLVFLTVPAFPSLWSYRDKDAGHLRRYTKKSLTEILQSTGFEILLMRYYQFALMPLALISRWLGRNSSNMRDYEDSPHSLLNYFLKQVNLLEVRLSNHIPFPWGTSLVAVGKRLA